MNLEDDDELIEIRPDPDQLRMYKDSSKVSNDRDSNLELLEKKNRENV